MMCFLLGSLVMRYLAMSETELETLEDGDYFNCVFFQVESVVNDG